VVRQEISLDRISWILKPRVKGEWMTKQGKVITTKNGSRLVFVTWRNWRQKKNKSLHVLAFYVPSRNHDDDKRVNE
jgi:hypothetical protein